MWNIKKIVSKGKYKYAVIPEHPKATKYGYVLLHRALVEISLGRLLLDSEVVHHKDYDTTNNLISNLEVMDKKTHNRYHGLFKQREHVDLQCPICLSLFTRYKNTTHLQKPSKYNCTCCSPSCRGKLSTQFQYNKQTPELLKNIENNVIKEYREITI